jgi:hypothetical protein
MGSDKKQEGQFFNEEERNEKRGQDKLIQEDLKKQQ